MDNDMSTLNFIDIPVGSMRIRGIRWKKCEEEPGQQRPASKIMTKPIANDRRRRLAQRYPLTRNLSFTPTVAFYISATFVIEPHAYLFFQC